VGRAYTLKSQPAHAVPASIRIDASHASACYLFSRAFSTPAHSGNGPALEAYPTSEVPAIQLHRDDWHRPHGSIKSRTPIGKLGLKNNLLRLHT
jgi:hypothetical protein